MTHIIDTLHQDHEKVSQLIEKLKGTTDGAEKTRSSICQQIKHELMSHAEFEEEVFYPALREANSNARKEVEMAFQEHQDMEQLLDEIEQMEATSDEFMKAVGRLETTVLDHVRHEEGKIFPLAKETLKQDDADQMSTEHDQMVQEHMQRAGI